jgi:hypothetical protein
MITSPVDTNLYGALANVAAITTALLAAVALPPLTGAIEIDQRKRASVKGRAQYIDAAADARRRFWSFLMLNVVAAIVNGGVLAAWWRVSVAVVNQSQWEYWLPWMAVVVSAGLLLLCAVSALVWLVKLGNVN